jgi:hypothetical protein
LAVRRASPNDIRREAIARTRNLPLNPFLRKAEPVAVNAVAGVPRHFFKNT